MSELWLWLKYDDNYLKFIVFMIGFIAFVATVPPWVIAAGLMGIAMFGMRAPALPNPPHPPPDNNPQREDHQPDLPARE